MPRYDLHADVLLFRESGESGASFSLFGLYGLGHCTCIGRSPGMLCLPLCPRRSRALRCIILFYCISDCLYACLSDQLPCHLSPLWRGHKLVTLGVICRSIEPLERRRASSASRGITRQPANGALQQGSAAREHHGGSDRGSTGASSPPGSRQRVV